MHGAHRQKKLHSTELIKSALWRSPHSTFLTEYNRLPAPSWSWKPLFPSLALLWGSQGPSLWLGCCPRAWSPDPGSKERRVDSASNTVITLSPFLCLAPHCALNKSERLQKHWDSKLKCAHNGCKNLLWVYKYFTLIFLCCNLTSFKHISLQSYAKPM